jgi:integrase/recombinase XerD
MKKEFSFPALLECFFMQRLMAQRQVSPHTIRSYRDTFRLLLKFTSKRLHKLPSVLTLADFGPWFDRCFPRSVGKRARQQRPKP